MTWRCVVIIGILLMIFVPLSALSAPLPEATKTALLSGDWKLAAESLKKSGLTDADAVSRLAAAHVCLATNRNNEAVVLFCSAEDKDLSEWKNWTEALLAYNPDNAVALYLYGDALARSGVLTGAERSFTQSLQKNEKFGLAWTARAIVRASLGRLDEAYLDLRKACEVEPTLAEAYASAGCLAAIQCNAEEAYTTFNKALKINPEFALAYNGRGCARYGLGRPDEAALDFAMARALSPVLAVAEANRIFVLAMVARQVDAHVPPAAQKPGMAIETKFGPQSKVVDTPGIENQGGSQPEKSTSVLNSISQSPLLTLAGLEAAYKDRGFDAVYRELSGMRQEVVAESWEVNRWMQKEYAPSVDRLNQGIMAVEATKSGIRTGKMLGILATDNLPAYFGQGSLYLAKDAVNWTAVDRLPAGEREVAKSILAGVNIDGTFDPSKVFLEANWQAATNLMKTGIDIYNRQANDKLRSIIGNPLTASKIDDSRQRLVAMEIARNPETFKTSPDSMREKLGGLSAAANLSWSQMPELAKAISSNPASGGPVVVMGQDSVRGFAFERMLNNRNVSTVVTPPLDLKELDRLRVTINTNSVVAFKTDIDDIKKMVFFPDDHGGGGAAVMPGNIMEKKIQFDKPDKSSGSSASALPSGLASTMIQLPRADGSMVNLPVPSHLQTPSATWGSLQQWVPKNDVGGLDTRQLEWVFVDKDNWPVLTFFTLAYSAQPKESKQ